MNVVLASFYALFACIGAHTLCAVVVGLGNVYCFYFMTCVNDVANIGCVIGVEWRVA